MRAINQTSGVVVATNVRRAHSPWARMLGLMGRKRLGEGEALLIDPCGSVHTAFMRFAIDVIFLDADNRVLKVAAALKPYRAAVARGAKRVLEATAGSAASAGVQAGDQLTFAD